MLYDYYIYFVGLIGLISLAYLLYGVILRMIEREVRKQVKKIKHER
ncbi:MAG: hypothetical protein H7A25_16705 [Leptospiraceae bacterium]|nr:hypothetical protein [Leptospiraceae bacterium]